MIVICSGIHTVDNNAGPLTIPGYVSLKGSGGPQSVFIAPTDATKSIFSLSSGNHQISELQISSPTSTTYAFVVAASAAGLVNFNHIIYKGFGLVQTPTTATVALFMRDLDLNLQSTSSIGIHIRNPSSLYPHYIAETAIAAIGVSPTTGVVGIHLVSSSAFTQPVIVQGINLTHDI